MDLKTVLFRSQSSPVYRTLLNWSLNRMIPFNKPHGFRVVAAGDDHLKVLLPYKRRNFNHIRGLHACALATASEFTTGLLLVSKLDPSKYRIIMQRLEMEYHYQGKMDATAEFSLSPAFMDEKIYHPLRETEAVVVPCEVKIHDIKGNHLTTGRVYWQVKSWEKVKTKQ